MHGAHLSSTVLLVSYVPVRRLLLSGGIPEYPRLLNAIAD